MQKKYETPSIVEIILEQECVLLASGEIGLETSGDGQLAPDIFFGS